MPPLPADKTPLSDSQFETLSKTLETLVNLIVPLHQLLEAQEALETGTTNRLEEIMEILASVAASLEASAKGLTRLTEAETLSPALATTLNRIEVHQLNQADEIAAMAKDFQDLRDWLGAPPHTGAAPS